MNISPDQTILWESEYIHINLTIVTTWGIMLLLVIISFLVTRRIREDSHPKRWQSILETIVLTIRDQIKDVGLQDPVAYLPFLGTIFLFIAASSLLTVIPGYQPPTASLSTTTALAVCVFVAVPFFGIRSQGPVNYLKSYFKPTAFLLPFNIIGELSRTLALAVRLFGNMMSGVMVVGVLLMVAPLLFPVLMTVLGLITGMVQAYIFSILAAVYIAASTQSHEKTRIRKKVT